MGLLFRMALGLMAFLTSGTQQTQAQTVQDYSMACISLDDLRSDTEPPSLARSVRDCVENERFDDAMRLFLGYSAFGTFDQQRVRDESGHMALIELNIWIFAGYSRAVMDELRVSADKLRDRESAFFLDACKVLSRLDPPIYRPTYLIARGMQPRKSDDDWRVVDFDADEAWKISLTQVNGCPIS